VLDDPALVDLLRNWGLAVIAPLSIVEGPIVSMAGGYLARLGVFDLLPLLIVLVLGDLTGDVALYLIGRKGRLVVRRRWLRRLRISPVQLARLVRRFRQQDVRLILFGKFTHYLGFATLLAAGVARMPFGRFLIACLIGTIPKSVMLVAIGWVFGEAWSRGDDWLLRALSVGLAVLALSLPLWFRNSRGTTPRPLPPSPASSRPSTNPPESAVSSPPSSATR
jgi:membrane protein DedA with SNARE-associated domain